MRSLAASSYGLSDLSQGSLSCDVEYLIPRQVLRLRVRQQEAISTGDVSEPGGSVIDAVGLFADGHGVACES
ncbi:MAG: hypothetical protein ABI885_24270 [Gammaproteobacteria bacterium]